jgi:hypothetical protein
LRAITNRDLNRDKAVVISSTEVILSGITAHILERQHRDQLLEETVDRKRQSPS